MTVIRPEDSDKDRWGRSRLIDWLDIEQVQSARYLVLGAGALGNETIKGLVLSGARDITLVDMDHVVRSNLSRCVMFREKDGAERRWKAEAVAERAIEIDPGARVRPVVGRIEQLSDDEWKTYDVVLGCLDNIAARLHANSHSYFNGVPYIDGGTEGVAGRVQTIVPPFSPCLQCGLNRSHYRVLERRHSCTGSELTYYRPAMAAEITTTSIIAAVQVLEALKLVCGRDDAVIRNVMHYNGLRNSWDELELSIEPACPLHIKTS